MTLFNPNLQIGQDISNTESEHLSEEDIKKNCRKSNVNKFENEVAFV